MNQTASPATAIRFESSILSLSLFPDSRGIVHFNLQEKDDSGAYHHLGSMRPLTCEYLTDLVNVTAASMHWIIDNCEDVYHEGRHIHFKFGGKTHKVAETIKNPELWPTLRLFIIWFGIVSSLIGLISLISALISRYL
jgi:hypothetical protein